MGSASSLHRCTTVAICSSQTLGAVSGLPEAASFSHRSARHGLVSWRCAELRSLLHVSEDLLSPFHSQPVEGGLGVHRSLASSPSCDTSAVRMLQQRSCCLCRCSDQVVVTRVGKPGFHLIIMPTSGEGGEDEENDKGPTGRSHIIHP